ncbi:MAG: GDSL-type esterase/lipase family protein [Acidobacteriota bacterium]
MSPQPNRRSRDRPPSGCLRALLVNCALALSSIALFLAVVELGLRLSGFSYVLVPQDIEFGKPDPVLLETGFLADPDLFWVTRDYPDKLARLATERPPLLFMGDSCTHLGHYDDELAGLVATRRQTRLRFGNLGVAGWSTHQGRRQLERDVLPLAPAVLTFYYGWNDHWVGFGIEDKNVALANRVFTSAWGRSRVVQLTMQGVIAIGARQTAYPNRVSRIDFEANLRSMIRQASAQGIEPVLITAATSHRRGEEPPELALRWLRELEDLVPLHLAYTESVRQVADAEDAILCDAAARFAELPRPQIESSFMADGIHLTAEGDRRLAEFLYACFERQGLWDRIVGS